MKFILIIILFLNTFYYSLSVVPVWNINSSAINLTTFFTNNKLSYASISLSGHGLNGTLRKELTINGDNITKTNYLSINGEEEFVVSYEDIDSVYYVADKTVICPKGKHHPQKLENGNFSELFPPNSRNIFEEKGNWDLKCYFHGAGISDQNGGGFLLLFYLMNGNKEMYDTDFNKYRNKFDWEACWPDNGAVGEELYNFKLKYGEVAFENNINSFKKYQMIAIVLEDNYIKLKSYKVAFESKWDKRDGVHINPFGSDFTLISAKKYNQAYFNFRDSLNDFYFISFNNNSDFSCGYSTKGFYEDYWFYFGDITIKNFSDSPFDFIDEVEITEIKIISNYRYAQYTIKNKKNGEYITDYSI